MRVLQYIKKNTFFRLVPILLEIEIMKRGWFKILHLKFKFLSLRQFLSDPERKTKI